ncbi:MAG: PSD1 and planctomycete cytochrome C domain-containing protein [Verrucomicrobiales bacterium]|nr:PSD1 and planctomycete cytochrome C domain-containing protein [Verrucomicrobiales bacterium]
MSRLLSILLIAGIGTASVTQDKAALEFFESKIRPVLVTHCYECHSSASGEIKADYLLDTRDGIRKGGKSGRDALIPGDINGSQLIEAIRHVRDDLKMPKKKLPDSVISDFEKWVALGAPDPRNGISKLPREIEAESHWAFQQVRKPDLPNVKDTTWPRDRLDYFVLSKLEENLMKPVEDADRYTLIRRATIELTGLLPTRQETDEFCNDPADTRTAFAKVVDRLLADPGFGERWGRHWLDVARYAESSSYSRNMLYPYAWRYRDWVIDALNADLPYNRFVRQQIAGDLLPADSPKQRDHQTIATGFLTIGPKTLNEADPLLFELNVADDQIDATCRAFLALTANCSRCHDHKYDPIPAQDYYALAGIFRSSRNLAGVATNVRFEHQDAFPLGDEKEQLLKRREAAITHAEKVQKEYLELVKKRNLIREPLEKQGLDWKKNPTPELKAAESVVQAFQAKVKSAKAAIPAPPVYAMAMAEAVVMSREQWAELFQSNKKEKKPTTPRIHDSPVFVRGDHKSPGKIVPRGTLSLFDKFLKFPVIDEHQSGRLQLANWLADEKNPATARVMVNRIWHHLFGSGLVDTVDNFGLLGSKPSHPELLDDLAVRFMQEGWSVKKLIRHLVLSRTWMLASTQDPSQYEFDPANRLLWRFSPQRIEGEVLRDCLLFVGGSLDRSRPQTSQVEAIANQMEKIQQREIGRRDYYNKDVKTDVTCRSVYLPSARGAIFDSMKLFDAPDPNLVVGARKNTTVPAQALFLMNSPLVIEQAENIANWITDQADTDKYIDEIYYRLLTRQPTSEEVSAIKEFLSRSGNNRDSWARAIHSLMATSEFRTVY